MKRYTYKDSGVEWIGEVPEHWEMKKVSHAFSTIGSGTTPIAGNPEYHNEGSTPWINTGDLNNGILKTCAKKITNIAFNDYSALKIYPIGSLIIAMYGATIGKVSILDFTACTNQACCVLSESKKWNVKYVFYWFIANKEHIVSMSYGGGQPNISQEIIKSLRIPLPERNEQYAIITYLDKKTTQIDDLISKKQKLIELLKEERAAIINQAVTKGLNPDAPMKDSGIEWIGEMPAHWEIKKLKYVAEINPSKSAYIEFRESDELVTFLPMEKVSEEGKIQIDIKKPIRELWNGFTCFEENDLIIAKITPCFENGKGALITSLGSNIGFGSTEFHVIRPRCLPQKYLFYITRTDQFMKFGEASMTGAAGQKRVPNEFIENYFVCYPKDKNEQNEISSFIHQKTTKIDQTTSKIEEQIDLLKEFRTTLISEVVTGKVDVRDEESK